MARVKINVDGLSALPPICVCCGRPATLVRRQEFEINSGTAAAILAASAAVGAFVWTKRGMTVSLPVCEYHRRRGRQSNRTFFRGMVLTAALGAAAYLASLFEGATANYLAVAAMFAFIVTIVVGMSEVNDGLGVRAVAGNSFTLNGVHKQFAEALSRSALIAGPSDPRA